MGGVRYGGQETKPSILVHFTSCLFSIIAKSLSRCFSKHNHATKLSLFKLRWFLWSLPVCLLWSSLLRHIVGGVCMCVSECVCVCVSTCVNILQHVMEVHQLGILLKWNEKKYCFSISFSLLPFLQLHSPVFFLFSLILWYPLKFHFALRNLCKCVSVCFSVCVCVCVWRKGRCLLVCVIWWLRSFWLLTRAFANTYRFALSCSVHDVYVCSLHVSVDISRSETEVVKH